MCQSAAAAAILGEAAQLPSVMFAAQSLGDLLISAASGLALHSSTSPPPPLPPHVPLPGAWALLADLSTALQPSCFDAECQREKDMLLEARCVWLRPGSAQCSSCTSMPRRPSTRA